MSIPWDDDTKGIVGEALSAADDAHDELIRWANEEIRPRSWKQPGITP